MSKFISNSISTISLCLRMRAYSYFLQPLPEAIPFTASLAGAASHQRFHWNNAQLCLIYSGNYLLLESIQRLLPMNPAVQYVLLKMYQVSADYSFASLTLQPQSQLFLLVKRNSRGQALSKRQSNIQSCAQIFIYKCFIKPLMVFNRHKMTLGQKRPFGSLLPVVSPIQLFPLWNSAPHRSQELHHKTKLLSSHAVSLKLTDIISLTHRT